MPKNLTKEEYNQRLKDKCRNDVFLVGDYISLKTKSTFQCKKCGHQWETLPGSVLNGTGCPVCSGHIVVPHLNSTAVLRSDLIKYFKNKYDAHQITPCSGKRVDLVCPDCGFHKTMVMSNLTNYGFSCPVCGDAISYPNKFIRSFVKQFKELIDYYEFEWHEPWTNKFIYDVYFEKGNQAYVIEMQGGQHYFGWGGKDLDKIQKNDEEKKKIACKNNIIPIIIDARISDGDYIIHNLYHSILSDIFDLSMVNWNECKRDAINNISKLICEDYNNLKLTIQELSIKYCLRENTIKKHLHKGVELGWCDYPMSQKGRRSLKTKIMVFDANNIFIGTYSSIKECALILSELYQIKFVPACISDTCRGKQNNHRGFVFKYV